MLSGSVSGQPVHLDMNVPASQASATGSFAGLPVSAAWSIADNASVYPDVPAQLTGTFAGRPVELRASFYLGPGYFFDHGTISGHIGGLPLAATAEGVSGGLGSTSAVAVDGTLGETEYTIYAAIDGTLTTGMIRGSVAGVAIRLDATRSRGPSGDETTRLVGSYEGPIELLALVAGALLHFM